MDLPTTVCLVDDAADFRFLVDAIFNQYMPTVSLRQYENGRVFLEGLPYLGATPNLILLDQHMPYLDGYQTLLDLKRGAFSSIPVIMMSADASHSETNRAYEAGARLYLKKPIDFTELKDELLKACRYASPAILPI